MTNDELKHTMQARSNNVELTRDLFSIRNSSFVIRIGGEYDDTSAWIFGAFGVSHCAWVHGDVGNLRPFG